LTHRQGMDKDLETGAERRRYFRLQKIIPARLEALETSPHVPADDEESDRARTDGVRNRIFVNDISAGGFGATSHERLRLDARLRAHIFIEREDPVTAICRVVRSKALTTSQVFEVGFEFTYIPADQWRRLVDYIVSEQTKPIKTTETSTYAPTPKKGTQP
jgi:c-di-GMP-binding flagellar brake protein YcgR